MGSITLPNFEREVISKDHLRFKNKNLVIHIQQEKSLSKHNWKAESLKNDVSEMFSTRKKMYELVGIKNVIFGEYELSKLNNRFDQLKITGEYTGLDNKAKWFLEDNIYLNDHVLQIKVLSSEGKVNEENFMTVINQLNISELVTK
jgi:hypothetical protein